MINIKIAKVPKGTARGVRTGGGSMSVIRYANDLYAERSGHALNADEANHAVNADMAKEANRLSASGIADLEKRLLFNNLFTPYIGTTAKNWSDITDISKITSVKVATSFWTDGFVSARGQSDNGGSSGGSGKSYLSDLLDVNLTSPTSGSVLIYNGSKWVNGKITMPDLTDYALESWVEANYVKIDSFGDYLSDAISDFPLLDDKILQVVGDSGNFVTIDSVENKGAILAFGQSKVIATIGGVNITAALPQYIPTDTKNTAGATDTSDKIFLIGATAQTANPRTYSHDTAYVGADGCLYSGGVKVLTAHQSIYDLTIKKNGTTVGTFDPDGAAKTIDITDVASASTLASHTGNTAIHITAEERTKWNKVVTDLGAILGTDSDTIINKWEEVVAFLDTYTEADTLAGLLGNKADKATTLEGYGITDALKRNGSNATAEGVSVMLNKLTASLGKPQDTDFYICQYAGGSSANTTYYRRPTSALWAYIKDKANALYQPKGNYLTAITKAQVEAVLTGDITSHTHSQYLTAHQSLADYYTKNEVNDMFVSNSSLDDYLDSFISDNPDLDYKILAVVEANIPYVTLNTEQTIDVAKTFTKDVVISKEKAFISTQIRKKENGGGWAHDHFQVRDREGNPFINIGAYGTNADLQWIYVGPETWNGNHNLKIYPDGRIWGQKFVKAGGTASQILMADGSVKALSDITGAYVSALGISGNYLTWTKNGVTNNITVPFAEKANIIQSKTGGAVTDFPGDRYTRLYTNILTTKEGLFPVLDNSNAILTLNRHAGNYYSQLGFSSDMNLYYRAFLNTAINTTEAWRKILDSGNYAATLDDRYYTEDEIDTKLANGSVTKIGTSTVGSGSRPIYLNAGVPTAVNYTYGNASTNIPISNGKVNVNLNADMLDGAHADDIRKTVLAFKIFTGTNTTGGYDLNTLAPDGGIVSNYGSYDYWANAPAGSVYGIALHIKGYSNLGGQFFADINHNSATDVTRSLWWRASGTVSGEKTWGQWHQIAFTDSNVDSASKLATSRTIWGQNFDGSANVSGALSNVTDINMSGKLKFANVYCKEDANNSIGFYHGAAGYAAVIHTGGVLASNNYADHTKVPSYGIYAKGAVKAAQFIKEGGTASQFLKADGTVDSNSYLLSSTYTAADVLSKIKTVDGSGSGLDADLLDGKHAGVKNGDAAIFVNFPTHPQLVSLGYNDAEHQTNTEYYFQGICKWAIDNYPGGGSLIGAANPDSQGFVHLHLYNAKHSSGYPTYCSGVWYNINGNTITFGTTNGIWYSGTGHWSINAQSATKLQTTRTLWGQSFNGTANVTGDMTNVGTINSATYQIKDSPTNPFLLLLHDSLYWYVQAMNGKMYVGQSSAHSMQIDRNGKVGIGLAASDSPQYLLDVAGPAKVNSLLIGTEAELWYDDDESTLFVENIGKLSVQGVIYSGTGIYSDGYVTARGQNTSDVRLKMDIRDFRAADIIRSLRPKAFKWNDTARSKFSVFDTDETQYGLIAQETIKSAPWLVDKDMFHDGYMGVWYDKLIPVLLKGEIELLATAEDHEQRIAELERENRELKRQITELQNA